MSILIKILELFFSAIVSGMEFIVETIENALKGDHSYRAEFISPSTLLSSSHRGFCLSGNKNLSVKNSYQNAMVIGGTGMGKSTVILIPSIYTMKDSSLVIHDPSGELYSKTAGFLAQQGYIVKILNFSKPENSCEYNPIQRTNSSSEIQKITTMLVDNTLGKSNDRFWQLQAISLLSMFITVLKKQELQYQNPYNLRHLLNHFGANPERIDLLFGKNSTLEQWTEFKSFNSYDDKVVSGVTATCKAALQIFSDESVAKVTAFDNLNLGDFRKRKTALFVQNSTADSKYYSVLTSIFFEQFFAQIMGKFPEENEQDIFFLIDECSSLNLPSLSLAVANLRKYRAGCLLAFQSESQMVNHYGKADAESIKSNCFAKLYFTGQGIETAKELSQILGQYQYEDEKQKTVLRSLMTSDEIRILPTNRALLIAGNYSPIKLKLQPYYKNWSFNSYSKIPCQEFVSENLVSAIPTLTLPEVPKKTKPNFKNGNKVKMNGHQ